MLEVRIYVNEQQAIVPSDLASAADRYIAARQDTKTKTEDGKPQANETSPAQPTPHDQNQRNQARVPSNQSNRPPHHSRHNGSYHPSHRDSHNMRDGRRTRQQQSPHVVSALTTIQRP
ncbi:hypothetical protein Bpfe_002719 [Biomphalaria pfeifferi]|uniref:Uncharacterized protein n=1 Tax=Biomphalaria pfeifferi TaxID=112525 RepID=A0AAD8FL26_BIOPF|nr:hypothetical protein Bpfe_002719 [Biomphalaria pfeifferi]